MKFFIPLFLLLTLAACSAGPGGESAGAAPAQHAGGVVISESEKGQGNWLLQAKEADFYQEPASYVVMAEPHLIFKVNGAEDSSIKSNDGRYDMDKNLITMTGKVVGVSVRENAQIETEKIYYDTQTKLVWVNAPVTITRAGVKVQGQGLKANSDFSQIEIFKQKTTLPPNIKDFETQTALKL